MGSILLSQNRALGVKVGLHDAVFYGFPCKLRPKPKTPPEACVGSLVPRPSRLQFLIAYCMQKLEVGRPGNEASAWAGQETSMKG